MKTLAVVGFLALIVFGTWLAIQVVRMAPEAFSSLASLAESLELERKGQNNIEILTTESVVNSNESFTVSWSKVKRQGTYVITYECIDGVSLDIRLENAIVPVPCGTPFLLTEGVTSIDAKFTSDKKRFVDVPYTIGFIKENESNIAFLSSKTLTIVNAKIPSGIVSGETTDETPKPEVKPETTVKPTVTPTTPKPTPTYAGTVGYTYTTTYKVPVSDPNGFTDLAVKFLGVGTINSKNEFVKKSELEAGEKGALQFEVKNIGTKTSSSWTFEADLPDGSDYDSKTQTALKPNERAVLTIALEDAGDDGSKKFSVKVYGGGDTKTGNNSFSVTVKVD
jgi:hypothetical protein